MSDAQQRFTCNYDILIDPSFYDKHWFVQGVMISVENHENVTSFLCVTEAEKHQCNLENRIHKMVIFFVWDKNKS